MIDMLLTAFIFILFLVIQIYIKKVRLSDIFLYFCWKGGIRTPVPVRERIYSPPHLAALPPSNICSPYGIRTRDLCRERAASWTARRTDHILWEPRDSNPLRRKPLVLQTSPTLHRRRAPINEKTQSVSQTGFLNIVILTTTQQTKSVHLQGSPPHTHTLSLLCWWLFSFYFVLIVVSSTKIAIFFDLTNLFCFYCMFIYSESFLSFRIFRQIYEKNLYWRHLYKKYEES